jgi:hypothetical protein
MKITNELYKDELFETKISKDSFTIDLAEESELTLDGGYSYEVVTNSKSLTKIQAIKLYEELGHFIAN